LRVTAVAHRGRRVPAALVAAAPATTQAPGLSITADRPDGRLNLPEKRMPMHAVRTLAVTGITIMSAAVLVALGAVGASAQGNPPFRYANRGDVFCLSENGDTSTVGASPCNTNHSEYWTFKSTVNGEVGQLRNLHSNLCLSVDGTTTLVGASPCNTNHAEYWFILPGNPLIANYHSGLCLEAVESRVVQTTCSPSDTLEQWTETRLLNAVPAGDLTPGVPPA
jgi:hypothetical protein